MNKRIQILAVLGLVTTAFQTNLRADDTVHEADVIIYGGTSSGVAAATLPVVWFPAYMATIPGGTERGISGFRPTITGCV